MAAKKAVARVKAGTSKASAADKRAAFVEAFFVTNENITKAAIAAGFSEKTAYQAGSRLLKDVRVSTEIARRRTEIVAGLELSTERTLKEVRSKEWVGPKLDLPPTCPKSQTQAVARPLINLSTVKSLSSIKLYCSMRATVTALLRPRAMEGAPSALEGVLAKSGCPPRAEAGTGSPLRGSSIHPLNFRCFSLLTHHIERILKRCLSRVRGDFHRHRAVFLLWLIKPGGAINAL